MFCPTYRVGFVNTASFSSASSKRTSGSLIMTSRLFIHDVGVTPAFSTGFAEWNVSFQSICQLGCKYTHPELSSVSAASMPTDLGTNFLHGLGSIGIQCEWIETPKF